MKEINRAVALIEPQPTFIEWLNKHYKMKAEMSMEGFLTPLTCLLVPWNDSMDECRQYVKKHYKKVFEHELLIRDLDLRTLTGNLTVTQFDGCFSIRIFPTVIDLADAPLTAVEIEV